MFTTPNSLQRPVASCLQIIFNTTQFNVSWEICILRVLNAIVSFAGSFSAADMMRILRDENSGICMTGGFLSTGSQVKHVLWDFYLLSKRRFSAVFGSICLFITQKVNNGL